MKKKEEALGVNGISIGTWQYLDENDMYQLVVLLLDLGSAVESCKSLSSSIVEVACLVLKDRLQNQS